MKKRKPFSPSVKTAAMANCHSNCMRCGKKLEEGAINFDHKDGDRSNNSLENCNVLCSDCHDKKSANKGKRAEVGSLEWAKKEAET
jgi:5-methylcytosine-specific restriction endonuclease McrA